MCQLLVFQKQVIGICEKFPLHTQEKVSIRVYPVQLGIVALSLWLPLFNVEFVFENQMSIAVCKNVQALDLIILIYLSVFMQTLWCFYYYIL